MPAPPRGVYAFAVRFMERAKAWCMRAAALAGRARAHASVRVKHGHTCTEPFIQLHTSHRYPTLRPPPLHARARERGGRAPPQVVYLWIGWARRLLHTDEVRAYRARLAREGDAPTPKRK